MSKPHIKAPPLRLRPRLEESRMLNMGKTKSLRLCANPKRLQQPQGPNTIPGKKSHIYGKHFFRQIAIAFFLFAGEGESPLSLLDFLPTLRTFVRGPAVRPAASTALCHFRFMGKAGQPPPPREYITLVAKSRTQEGLLFLLVMIQKGW
jgi:hypothetical protein